MTPWKETFLRTKKSCSGICNYRTLCSGSNRSSTDSGGIYVVVAVVLADNCNTGTNSSSKRSSDRVASI